MLSDQYDKTQTGIHSFMTTHDLHMKPLGVPPILNSYFLNGMPQVTGKY